MTNTRTCGIIITEREKKGDQKMIARNEIEKKVLEMVKNGEKLHGLAREILIEMQLREME